MQKNSVKPIDMISSQELRKKFLDFHKSKSHLIIPSASIVPKEDPTVLFVTAGMQPVIPFLLGAKYPTGDLQLANSQKCLRTDDIDEVGDNRHTTFFEMLGNWSLGSYFKKEIISWSMEFLTSNEWLNLDPKRIFVTVYKGNNEVEADLESIEYWKQEYFKLGIEADIGDEYKVEFGEMEKYLPRIRLMSGKDNWWGLPYKGPCGPCSEMYYLMPNNPTSFEDEILKNLNPLEIVDFIENQVVEIGNNVFMEYEGEKDSNKEPINLTPLKQKNIDTGLGFERFLAVINGKSSVYETDVFNGIICTIRKFANK
jgi:alanyl-tRNA synthetase